MDAAEVTQLLQAYTEGQSDALDALMPAVYQQLRGLAHRYLRGERMGHTLNTTALVHEAYLKLIDQNRVQWQSRQHFYAIAAQAMRRILVNYARNRQRIKRGGNAQRVEFDEALGLSDERADEVLALDEALTRLEASNERRARIVECRYFVGFTIEETAAILEISPRTVKREWTVAKAWLYREMTAET
ncbi:MAG: sigma-70 family RNA polymerase sigma factor [Rhodothermales bacterium]